MTLCTLDSFFSKNIFSKKRIIVGFSGGADSSALLFWLTKNKEKYGFEVEACHVHHGIRGEEADADLSFCQKTCQSLGVTLHTRYIDTITYANKTHKSLETAARILRYECFETLAKERDAYIATAHNLNDQVETMLFRLARGTGLKGLVGIPKIRDFYIRPLLEESADSIREYCQENGIHFCVDSTNLSDDYSRNQIRHQIVPKLESLNPKFLSHMSELASLLEKDESYLQSQAEKLLTKEDLRQALICADEAISSRVIRTLYAKKQLSEDAITTQQIDKILKLLKSDKKYGSYSLPCDITFYMEDKNVFFEKTKKKATFEESNLHMGLNILEDRKCAIFISDKKEEICEHSSKYIYNLLTQSKVFFDTINPMLRVRSKMEGDTCIYGGMTHKLKKLFNDKKIPLEERDRLPIILYENEIVWVPGFSPREPKEKDQYPLFFFYYQLGEKND